MGRAHSDEVRTYVVHRRLEGAQHNEIIGEVKAKFNEVVSDSWIYAAFREAGCVQFNDIKGVIKVGQEEQRQKTSI